VPTVDIAEVMRGGGVGPVVASKHPDYREGQLMWARLPAGALGPAGVGSAATRCENRPIAERYVRPDWFTEHAFNRAVAALTRVGVSVAGSRVLEVRGRKSGEPRRTPVNLLTFDCERYLVAPRGHTQWVRNLRAQGEGRLLLGRRAEQFTASELADDDKLAILRAS
jgi:deazaflavin-dependent oxidoreductase (nitroreductase family)